MGVACTPSLGPAAIPGLGRWSTIYICLNLFNFWAGDVQFNLFNFLFGEVIYIFIFLILISAKGKRDDSLFNLCGRANNQLCYGVPAGRSGKLSICNFSNLEPSYFYTFKSNDPFFIETKYDYKQMKNLKKL